MRCDNTTALQAHEFAQRIKGAAGADRALIILCGYDELAGKDGSMTVTSAPTRTPKDLADMVVDILTGAASVLGATGHKIWLQDADGKMREFKVDDTSMAHTLAGGD